MSSYIRKMRNNAKIDVIETSGRDRLFANDNPRYKINKKRKFFSCREYGNIFYMVEHSEDDYDLYDKEYGIGKLRSIYFDDNDIGAI